MNKILECVVGSNLYGTNNENSDKDILGIFIAEEDNYLGLNIVEEITENIVSKNDSGKNNTDAVDKKFYEIKNFFKLAFQNNPNIIELFYINEPNIVFKNEVYDVIKENSIYFLDTEQIKNRFLGYACSQKHKMIIKLENYDILKEAYDILENSDKKFLVDETNFNKFEFRKNINTEYRVADISIPRNISIKRAKDILQTRLGRVGHRQELILKYGYDCKYSSHALRLLKEGKELLQTGKIEFPLKDRNLLLDIKNGKYVLSEVLEMIEEEEESYKNLKLDRLYKHDFNKINDLLIYLLKNSLFFEKRIDLDKLFDN